MPFGAHYDAHQVRFALWAPAATRVALHIERHAQPLAMTRDAGGWFRAVAPTAAGSRYLFRIDDQLDVPDPASRFQPEGVAAASEVIDGGAYLWHDGDWRGRPWHEAIVYELHVGAFSATGDYAGVRARLDELVDLGVTAIELMPLADFAGARNWGYDGVLPFAPARAYGRPEELKALIDAAHARGLMVILDVVYNHFGPAGNWLARYAPAFFSRERRTPWGEAIDFDGDASATVREFFLQNALYWLEEYHFDGLRLDAVHAIVDTSSTHILAELAARVAAGPGRTRAVHLILENDSASVGGSVAAAGSGAGVMPADVAVASADAELFSAHTQAVDAGVEAMRAPAGAIGPGTGAAGVAATGASALATNAAPGTYAPLRPGYRAQWHDDLHHALHVVLTGETGGYYARFAAAPLAAVAAALRGRSARAIESVVFLQNHDQIGNRVDGARLIHAAAPVALRAATALVLLAPMVPLLFMGEEWGARAPFPFFCDFPEPLASAVRAGRRQEFARFPAFASGDMLDPLAPETFARAVLARTPDDAASAATLAFYRTLLRIRREYLLPLLGPEVEVLHAACVADTVYAAWRLQDGSQWHVIANLTQSARTAPLPPGVCVFASDRNASDGEAGAPTPIVSSAMLPPWSVRWYHHRP